MYKLGYAPRSNGYYTGENHELPEDMYFVFGSNNLAVHGKGSALTAKHYYGACHLVPQGHSGQSYAIPTRKATPTGGRKLEFSNLPLEEIARYVSDFVDVTNEFGRQYYVTAIGCGLAGYTPADIAPLFKGAVNCWFPESFRPYLETK